MTASRPRPVLEDAFAPRVVSHPTPEANESEVAVTRVSQSEAENHSDEERLVPSNVHLPVALCERVLESCGLRGMTTGELFIEALEQTYDDLPRYVHPGGKVGGKLFKERGVGSSSRAKAPTKQLAYSLYSSDFTVLDALRVELTARSRSHLLTAALTAYFETEGDN